MRILILFMVLAAPGVAALPKPPRPVTAGNQTKVENQDPMPQRPFKRLILKDGSL
jgi:hypothetical protein